MTDTTVRGTMTTADEDREFLRFFRIVQNAASAIDMVFFLWSPECHDGQVGDVWCEDLSGWLVPVGEADEFEPLWASRDPQIWSDVFVVRQAFARWEDIGGQVRVTFEHPLSGE